MKSDLIRNILIEYSKKFRNDGAEIFTDETLPLYVDKYLRNNEPKIHDELTEGLGGECPNCGEKLKHGLDYGTLQLFKDSKLFNKTPKTNGTNN